MEESTSTVEVSIPPNKGLVNEWASDQKAFKGVPWGKAMMWIFLVSDTFVFSIFLISYMTVRFSTKAEWPNPSEVFGLHVGHYNVPLLVNSNNDFYLNYKQWHNGFGSKIWIREKSKDVRYFDVCNCYFWCFFCGYASI